MVVSLTGCLCRGPYLEDYLDYELLGVHDATSFLQLPEMSQFL